MKNLKRKISQKLDQLQELLDIIDDVRIINADDPDTWDSDFLYNLVELQSNQNSFSNERQNLKEALKILEDQPLKGKDEFSQPLYEDGLCSLIDLYQEDQENDD